MSDTRRKDTNWNIGTADPDGRYTFDQIQTSILMDIRDELKRLNDVLHYQNFLEIRSILRIIRNNTAKPRKKREQAK